MQRPPDIDDNIFLSVANTARDKNLIGCGKSDILPRKWRAREYPVIFNVSRDNDFLRVKADRNKPLCIFR